MFDNLDYFNKKRLLDNEVYGYLSKLKELKNELPEIASGLDYYKMWLNQYNRNKDSLTAKSNVEEYVGMICEKQRDFDKVLEYTKNEFERIGGEDGIFIFKFTMDFVFDRYRINTIRKIYNIKYRQDLLDGLKALCDILTTYWR